MFVILIAGSRTYNEYLEFVKITDIALQNHINDEILIVSGGATGADHMAEKYAEERNIPIKIFKADWQRYGKSAGYWRNIEMHEFIKNYPNRGCLCFWDGQSPGTKQNFDIAAKYHTPLRIYNYKTKKIIIE